MLPQRRPDDDELQFDIDLELDGGPCAPGRRRPRPPRVYRLRDAAWLLASFALTLLLLDADGLHAWVTRMDVGPAQDLWASAVEPWRQLASRAGLTAPRRLAIRTADQLAARWAGDGAAEALLARGWTPDAGRAPAAAATIPAPPAASPASPEPDSPARASPAPAAPGPAATAGVPAGPLALAPVMLMGDSLMVTMAPAVTRALLDDPPVPVLEAYRSATGLSRPDVYDWPAVAASFLETHHPHLVICSFGGNDAQDVRAPDGEVLRFGTEAWDALYAERIRAIMTMLRGSGAEVLWLGVPPMRGHAFDDRMQHLNGLFAQEAAAAGGITFEQTGPLVGGKDGRFAEFLRNPRGKLVRVRTPDGIHYTEEGGQRVARRVRSWVDERLAAQRTASTSAPAQPRP